MSKNCCINLRLTIEQKTAIKWLADKLGKSMTDVIIAAFEYYNEYGYFKGYNGGIENGETQNKKVSV